MEIHQLPILMDNYCHVLVCSESGKMAVVDPAEPEKVIPFLKDFEMELEWILCTHHHWDHAGGNEEVLKVFPEAKVAAGERDIERIFGATHSLKHGDTLQFGKHTISVLSVPCHTRGHVAYLIGENLFSGDTLFVAGCGRFFEGEASEMDEALNSVFAALPANTRVFCGHEYTVSNLAFAASVEPGNAAITRKLEWAKKQIEEGVSTVPSTLKEEAETNPFMRVRLPEIQKLLDAKNAVEAMAALRERKNNFKGS